MIPVQPLSPRRDANPKLAVIGGRLEDDNAAVYSEMHRLAGGRIVVFATASSEPETVGPEALAVFRAHGFDAALAPVHGDQAAGAVDDPAVLALVRDYGSVYFTGGDQTLITRTLAPEGRETPLLKAIREVYAQGGLIAGSSAGAAMMSDTMIEGGTSLEATTFGVVADPDRPGLLLGRGLGFFRWGIVDQHFIKRGRFGRLVVAMAESSTAHGFGVDENTALFVDGARAHVVGEYGAFVLDMREARVDRRQRLVENILFTYLDDGDAIDLAQTQVTPGTDKKRVGWRDVAYRAPARSLRNVFGAYTLYDLLARLVLGDPESYTTDRARAIEPTEGVATTVEFERLRGVSQPMIAVRDDALRMTAVDFRATLTTRKLNAAQLAATRHTALARDYGVKPGPAARLMLLGSSPLRAGSTLLQAIDSAGDGRIGIIACASADPREEADAYLRALATRGREAIDFGITIDNIEVIGRDAELVECIAGLKTIVLTGGNQIRLVESLLHRGEVTPVLQAVARAHAVGGAIVAISGAASALSGSMIAGGSSYESLRFGIASDMGRRGLIIQQGLGLFGAAIVDQNLDSAHRLGRLVVACAEEGVRYGVGLLEDSGVVANRDNSELTVIGAKGVVLVEVDPAHTELQGDEFIATGTMLSFALPGDTIDLNSGKVRRASLPNVADAALQALVHGFIDDCYQCRGAAVSKERSFDDPIALRFTALGQGCGTLDVEAIRDRFG
jgi:cyanophycinase